MIKQILDLKCEILSLLLDNLVSTTNVINKVGILEEKIKFLERSLEEERKILRGGCQDGR